MKHSASIESEPHLAGDRLLVHVLTLAPCQWIAHFDCPEKAEAVRRMRDDYHQFLQAWGSDRVS